MGIGGAILYSLVVMGVRAILRLGQNIICPFHSEWPMFVNGAARHSASFYRVLHASGRRLQGMRPKGARI